MIRKTYFEIAAFFEFPTWKFKLPGNSNEKKNISLAENSLQAHACIYNPIKLIFLWMFQNFMEITQSIKL